MNKLLNLKQQELANLETIEVNIGSGIKSKDLSSKELENVARSV